MLEVVTDTGSRYLLNGDSGTKISRRDGETVREPIGRWAIAPMGDVMGHTDQEGVRVNGFYDNIIDEGLDELMKTLVRVYREHVPENGDDYRVFYRDPRNPTRFGTSARIVKVIKPEPTPAKTDASKKDTRIPLNPNAKPAEKRQGLFRK